MSLQHQCPRCGYILSVVKYIGNPFDTTDASSESKHGVDLLHQQAHRLEATIRQLSIERANVLRKINETQSSTRMLPVEILTTIFAYLVSPSAQNSGDSSKASSHFQLTLGAVSSYWRQVVWSTPAFWTTAILDIRPVNVQHNTTLLSLYIRNSGTCPIYLDLDFISDNKLDNAHGVDSRRLYERLKPLRNILFSAHPSKIQNLKLDGIPFKWLPLLPSRFPHIQSLNLGWWPKQHLGPGSRSAQVILNFPRLRKVVIQRVLPWITLPWAQLTMLTCHMLPIDVCLHLLTSCPNLVEYRNQLSAAPTNITSAHLDNTLTSDKHVRLEKLRCFEWSYYHTEICQKLIFLELPALKTLQWTDAGQALSLLADLLIKVPTITSLALGGRRSIRLMMQETARWKEIFTTSMVHLTHLRLFHLYSVPYPVLDILNPESKLNRDGPPGTSLALPSLVHLSLMVTGGSDQGAARFDNSALIHMLEARREVSRVFTELYLEVGHEVEWGDGARDRYSKLAQGGLKLEIIENSKRVSWL